MKEWPKRILTIAMTVLFTVAVLRVSTNSFMSAEEELIETISKGAKNGNGFTGINFFDIFSGEQDFALHSARNYFNQANNRLNYQDPFIDMPLMPPELKTNKS